ncbi:MAG: LysM peptidoglycan-binding domain-containing protein [Ardenticatenaceae bacterium]|nr:LysM peptidoglycan-binding domain-containing protein [Ardenticatenaceae bacterium]MCB8986324.1 LysM peptidoglycan-binding domain-containing protein [Ardenticatenaceae bacterium]
MKRKINIPFWMVLAAASLLLVLSACVRPVPQPEASPTAVPVENPSLTPESNIATPFPVDTAVPYPAPGETVEGSTPTPGGEVPGGETQPTATPETGNAGPQSHTVQPGETLASIAQQYNVPAEEIAAANNLTNVNQLDVGQVLIIPAPGTTTTNPGGTTPPTTGEQVHVVQAGENLFRIALSYGMTTEELAAYNGITNPSLIYVGQVIRIPPR